MRAILILIATVASLVALFVLVVGIGVYRIRAAEREADRQWTHRAAPTTAPAFLPPPPETEPSAEPEPVLPPPEPRPIILFAIDCKLHGKLLWKSGGLIGNWKDSTSFVEWPFYAAAPGTYTVQMTYALGAEAAPFTIEVADQILSGQTVPTADFNTFTTVTVGTVQLPTGRGAIRVKPVPGTVLTNAFMHLRSVFLVPAGMVISDPAMNVYTLEPADAERHGSQVKLSEDQEPRIVNWISPDDWIEWSIRVPQQRSYRVDLTLSNADTTGGDFAVKIGRESVNCHAGSTGDFDHPRTVSLGQMTVPAGRVSIEIRANGQFRNALMNVWKVVLVPQ